MFNSQYPTAFTEGRGCIKLSARVLIGSDYVEANILDASAETHTARVRVPGRFDITVPFSAIANVALKYGNGEIIENFGKPNINRVESIAYIEGVQYA